MTPISAPDPLANEDQQPRVFLAGAIDGNHADRWQDRAITALEDMPGTVLNPRRDAWDASWGNDLDDPRFAEQVQWELDGLERADVILCWLPAGSMAPISLLELGLHARSGKVLVGCEPVFYRHGNVAAVCQRYGIPLYSTWADAINALRLKLENITAHGVSHVG